MKVVEFSEAEFDSLSDNEKEFLFALFPLSERNSFLSVEIDSNSDIYPIKGITNEYFFFPYEDVMENKVIKLSDIDLISVWYYNKYQYVYIKKKNLMLTDIHSINYRNFDYDTCRNIDRDNCRKTFSKYKKVLGLIYTDFCKSNQEEKDLSDIIFELDIFANYVNSWVVLQRYRKRYKQQDYGINGCASSRYTVLIKETKKYKVYEYYNNIHIIEYKGLYLVHSSDISKLEQLRSQLNLIKNSVYGTGSHPINLIF